MNEEAAFVAAIAASPDDELGYLVFADWLQEQGDPRGEWLRNPAIRAVMGPGLQNPLVRLEELFDEQPKPDLTRAIVAIGEDAVEPLMGLARSGTAAARVSAIDLLAALSKSGVEIRESARRELLDLFESPEAVVRAAARRAIRHQPTPAQTLPPGLFNDDADIRAEALGAWREFSDLEEFRSRFVELVRHPDPDIRWKFVTQIVAIVAMESADAEGLLLDALGDPDPRVLHAAIMGLRMALRIRFHVTFSGIRTVVSSDGISRTIDTQLIATFSNLMRWEFWPVGRYAPFASECGPHTPGNLKRLSWLFREFPSNEWPDLFRSMAGGTPPHRDFTARLLAHVERTGDDPSIPLGEVFRFLLAPSPVAERVADPIRRLLRDGPDRRVFEICFALSESGSGAAFLAELVWGLRERRVSIEWCARGILASGPPGIELAVQLLGDPSAEYLEDVLIPLPRAEIVASSPLAERLTRIVADGDYQPAVRTRAAVNLWECGLPFAEGVADLSILARHLEDGKYVGLLLGLGVALVSHLPALERDAKERADSWVPARFAQVLARLPVEPQVVSPYLRRMFADADASEGTILAAIRAMKEIGDLSPADIPALLDFLPSAGDRLRVGLVGVLSEVGTDPRTVPVFLNLLNDSCEAVRREAIRVLGEWGIREAIEPLTERLRGAEEKTALAIIFALKTIGDLPPTSLEAVETMRSDPRNEIRKRATELLRLSLHSRNRKPSR